MSWVTHLQSSRRQTKPTSFLCPGVPLTAPSREETGIVVYGNEVFPKIVVLGQEVEWGVSLPYLPREMTNILPSELSLQQLVTPDPGPA